MRRIGKSKRLFCSAARTRSRASRTSVSGKPTSVNAGKPFAKCTSTVTSGADIPDKPRLRTTASVIAAVSSSRSKNGHGARFYRRIRDHHGRSCGGLNRLRDWSIRLVSIAYPSFWVRGSLIGRRKNDPFGLIFVKGGPRRRGTIQSRFLIDLTAAHLVITFLLCVVVFGTITGLYIWAQRRARAIREQSA